MTDFEREAQALIDWIHSQRTFSKKHGLDNMRRLQALLGNPEQRFPSIHIAGTNGKGSVCALIERGLRANGYLTGLYTSPYLTRYQERIQLSGKPIDDETFVRCARRVKAAAEVLHQERIFPTVFELGTALALSTFAEKRVDFAVIEAGLGGRLDPTNIIVPEVCVIANIGLDHMEVLGDTIEQIAMEKAGIIKDGLPVVLYPQQPEVLQLFQQVSKERHAPLTNTGDFETTLKEISAHGTRFITAIPPFGAMDVQLRLPGHHQISNAVLALATLAQLRRDGHPVDKHKALEGIRFTDWPGRLEWLSDTLLLDGAHNEQGSQALVHYIQDFLSEKKITLLTAMMSDKRPEACAKLLAPLATRVVATQVDWPRALPAKELAQIYRTLDVPSIAQPDIKKALMLAQQENSLVVVCGSLYLIGTVKNIIAST